MSNIDKASEDNNLKKLKILEDDYLEDVGLIKEIDTLSLITNTRRKKQFRNWWQDVLYTIMVPSIAIMQILTGIKFGVLNVIILNSILSAPVALLALLILYKKNRRGVRV
ncbi:hypothetical protein [Clostridium manihotivorum]|uniref:Uncharacterized protein n=1 Tax=Clostridium manihotivorum TaxID=2320868 RepID=A0A3R5UDM9_9CLOT|nr:hypothetical protein [Clostridium manihotivorum]QAA30922.1 hypothetical protein C1I91_04160 [Clostridium manihotivorum]